MALGIPPHQLWSITVQYLPLHSPGASPGEGTAGGESTELVAASLSSAQGPGCCCPPWVGTAKGKEGSSTMSRAGPPGSPRASNEPAPCCIPAAPHGSPSTCTAALGRVEEEEQLCEPRPGIPGQQPPCSKFARPQPPPRSWLSAGQHQFLPASCCSPSLQCSETGSELPPGRKRKQRRDRDSNKRHRAAITPPAAPRVIPHH